MNSCISEPCLQILFSLFRGSPAERRVPTVSVARCSGQSHYLTIPYTSFTGAFVLSRANPSSALPVSKVSVSVSVSVLQSSCFCSLQVSLLTMATKTASTCVVAAGKSYACYRPIAHSRLTWSWCLVLLLCNTHLIGTVSGVIGGAGAGSFEYCFQQRQMGAIGSCLGQRALTYLQHLEDSQNVTFLDGTLKMERSDKDLNLASQSRTNVNFLDLNPTDFR